MVFAPVLQAESPEPPTSRDYNVVVQSGKRIYACWQNQMGFVQPFERSGLSFRPTHTPFKIPGIIVGFSPDKKGNALVLTQNGRIYLVFSVGFRGTRKLAQFTRTDHVRRCQPRKRAGWLNLGSVLKQQLAAPFRKDRFNNGEPSEALG